MEVGDGASVHALHGDPTTNLHNPYGAVPDRRWSERMLRGWIEHRQTFGFAYELAFEGDELAGICGVRTDVWLGHPVLNLYWRLMPEFWGRGFGSVLGRHAFDAARALNRNELIVARMLPANSASAHIARGLGLVRRPDLDGRQHEVAWIVFADAPAGAVGERSGDTL